ncbi:MAG: PAS domain-containing protein, partial [Arcobacteraceae bacterium]|nr:PAS domain-containing protein [Arcobacteraceae bacterium]
MLKNKYSLYTIIGINILLVVLIIISVYATYTYIQTKDKIIEDMKLTSNHTIESLQKNVVSYIESYSPTSYENLILNEMSHENILAIVLEDYNMGKILGINSYISGKIKDDNWNLIDYDFEDNKHLEKLAKSFYTNTYPVTSASGEIIGKITIYITDYSMKLELKSIIISNIINSIAISLLLIITLFLTIHFLMLKPLASIIDVINYTDEDGIPVKLIPNYGAKEIHLLVNTMNNMIQTIKHERMELEENEQRYSSLLDSMQEMVFIKDSKLRYILTNKALENFFGLTKEQLFFRNDYDFMDKDSAQACMASDGLVISKQELVISAEQIGDRIFETHKFPVKISENRMGLGCYVVDITEKKKQEQDILEAKEKLEITLEAVKIGIWEWDIPSGKVIWDKNCYELLGYTYNEFEVTYDVWQALQHPDDMEQSNQDIQEQLKDDNHYSIEFRLKKADGSWMWIDGRGKSVLSDSNGNPIKMVGTHTDITAIKEYEESLEQEVTNKTKELNELNLNLENRIVDEVEKNRQKDILLQQQTRLAAIGEMMGNIAHQWRQPLSAITATISGLKLKEEFNILESNDIAKANDSIMKSAEFLSKTIENFRNFFSKNNFQKDFLVVDSIQDTLDIIKASYENHFIKVNLNTDTSVSYFGNENLLSQVMLNILSNSKDALLQNHIENKIVSISLMQEGENIKITIKDNAHGIPIDIIDKIFDPYFTTKHQSQGTGLG